jgi:hypothetical protein
LDGKAEISQNSTAISSAVFIAIAKVWDFLTVFT